jgi:hypothetical protein
MRIVLAIMPIALNLPVHAWKGEDVDTGKSVSIPGAGNNISYGDTVVVYAQEDSAEYFAGTVISKFGFGREVQLEVREETFGDKRIFNMRK